MDEGYGKTELHKITAHVHCVQKSSTPNSFNGFSKFCHC